MTTLLNKQEAATRLGVSVKTVERRLKAGQLRREYVHGPHGPEVRVVFDDAPPVVDATFTVQPATNGAADVYHVAPATTTPDRSG